MGKGTASKSDYGAARKDSKGQFSSSSSASSGTSTCPLKAATEPCDADYVFVGQTRKNPRSKTWVLKGGKLEEKADEDKRTELEFAHEFVPGSAPTQLVKLGAGKLPEPALEVTAGPPGAGTTTSVRFSAQGAKFCGAEGHPHLEVVMPDGSTTLQRQKEVTLDVHRPARLWDDSVNAESVLSAFWFWDLAPQVYEVRTLSCGVRDEGLGSGGSVATLVRVYPDDEFKFKFGMPPFGKVTHKRGAAMTYGKQGQDGDRALATEKSRSTEVQSQGRTEQKQESSSVHAGSQGTFTKTETTGERSATTGRYNEQSHTSGYDEYAEFEETVTTTSTDSGKKATLTERSGKTPAIEHVVSPPRSKFTFELSRNGEAVQSIAKIGEIVDFALNFNHRIKEVFKQIKDFKPQVGWDMTFDVSVFEGTLELAWGWRESKEDQRCFFRYAIAAELTIVKASIELSFGFEAKALGVGLIAKVSGTVGGSFALDATAERASPESVFPSDAKLIGIKGGPTGELKAVVVVGKPEWLSATAAVDTGITVEGGLYAARNKGPHVKLEAKWIGIKLTATSVVRGKQYKKVFVLVEETEIWSGTWPKQAKADAALKVAAG